ncbi:AAA ATPase central domain protein [Rhodopseudomonas palustris TIE-1]|uniref:AAA family ATPase n=1 Tax=Rhodopseudomonas palustris TaxID=1076 RepID=UPI000164B32F|nr:AAA family ATPase [Rhodopseudomonas palustris]ACF02312.1 AAA ATPase central domain protein [Rhodopseudomonas palustris TIE-1]
MSTSDSKSKAWNYWLTMLEQDRAECAPAPDGPEIVERPTAALVTLLCQTQREAVDYAIATTENALRDRQDRPYADIAEMRRGTGVDEKIWSEACRVIAGDLEAIGGPRVSEAALCWWMLAASPRDPETCSVAVDLDQLASGVRWPEKADEIKARVRVWLDAHAGEYEHDDRDLFAIAEDAVQRATEAKDSTMRKVYDGVPLSVLMCDDETAAVKLVVHYTKKVAGMTGAKLPAVLSVSSTPPKDGDRRAWWRTECRRMSSDLTERADDGLAGAVALTWRMLAADQADTRSFLPVLPALTYLADRCDWSDDDKAKVQARLRIWTLAASGEYGHEKRPMLEIASRETDMKIVRASDLDPEVEEELFFNRSPSASGRRKVRLPSSPRPRPAPDGPAVVVMTEAPTEKKHLQDVWKRLDGADVALVVCRDACAVRRALEAEYPHARAAVAKLTQDLRDGEPVRMRPTLLVGPPGSGKSRMVRRLAELLNVYVYRVDATAAADGFFAGTNRSWHSSAPSVPARAIAASMRANPIVMVDEIEKAAESALNGNLWAAMTPFLERETSQRYRDVGLDAELDLSHVSHIATANSVDRIPSFLRDRFRLIRVPAPSLSHLPALAALVLQDIARDDDARAGAPPLAPDELDVIGLAWARERYSMRKLARLVEATLEARDACAPRH